MNSVNTGDDEVQVATFEPITNGGRVLEHVD